MLPDLEVLTKSVTTAESLCKSAKVCSLHMLFWLFLALRPTQHMSSCQDPYKSLSNQGKMLANFSTFLAST